MEKLTIKSIEHIEKILRESDPVIDHQKISQSISHIFDYKKAVLGFDIYQYSKYPKCQQALIPYIFKELYMTTIQNCLAHEPFLLQGKGVPDFEEYFIDMGDGGFQIFDTPFHAVIFAIYFQANMQRYNSCHCAHPYLRKFVGEISLRYSLAYNSLYKFKGNFYGSSIINSSRILSRDKLNRFIIDNDSYKWFMEQINGIENLTAVTSDDFKDLQFLDLYKPLSNLNVGLSLLFQKEKTHSSIRILSSEAQKIGDIVTKQDKLHAHSIYIQALLKTGKKTTRFKKFTVSLGNLNPMGISDS